MSKGRFGNYGGQYIPETLMKAVEELEESSFFAADEEFVVSGLAAAWLFTVAASAVYVPRTPLVAVKSIIEPPFSLLVNRCHPWHTDCFRITRALLLSYYISAY